MAAGRAPIHTILRGSLLSLRVVPWLLLGFLCPLFPGKADWDAFLLVFGVLCASNVAIGCLVAWRWLTAAPLSRTRAFGILFAPFLAMLVLGPSIRAAVVEVQDRTVLYEKHWFSYADGRGRFPVQFVPVDRSRQAEEDVLGGSPETLVSRTGDHLAARFGIAGSARVREAILRGWPGGGGVPTKDDVNTEVPAALDRVRAAFLPELRTVLHRRMLADAMAALVLGSLLLILQTTLRPPWKTTAWFVAVLPLVMMTVPNLGLGGFAPALAVRDAYYGAFTASPIPCSLAALASSALLLGVALGGFRRMEYDDLPPATAGRKM